MSKSFVIQNYEILISELEKKGTAADISKKTGIPRCTINNWFRKIRRPNSKHIDMILGVYNISPKEFGVREIINDEDTIGKRLKKFLNDNDISQVNFGEQLGVKNTTVSNWIKDKFKPEIKYLEKMAEEFEISIDYLLTGETEQRDSFMEIGLNQKAIEKIKKMKTYTKPQRLFELPYKTIEDIGEIDILNYIIADTDFFEFFKKQLNLYYQPYFEIEKIKELSKKQKKINVKAGSKKYQDEQKQIEIELRKKTSEIFIKYFEKEFKKITK